MICDAHVHVGYYTRFGRDEPFYWSPRKVAGVLSRCGVGEFIVSSTNAQVAGIARVDILREAREMRLRAGAAAHQFYWLSGRLYDEDRNLSFLDTGLFEGLKFHELETPWMQRRKDDLLRVLAIAEERRLPVMFHCAPLPGCSAADLATLAERFPAVRFNFAHFNPPDETIAVMERCHNVFADISTLRPADFQAIPAMTPDVMDRILFGTDFPAMHARTTVGLAAWYRKQVEQFASVFDHDRAIRAFHVFLGGQRA